MNKRIRDTLVALFVLGGIALVIIAFFWFSGRMVTGRRGIVTVYFSGVAGLRVGDPVQVLGIEKGKVVGLKLEKNLVVATVALDRDFVPTRDTKFAIRSVSYLGGDRYLMVTPGDSGPAGPNAVFRGVNESLELEETFLRLDKMLTELNPTQLTDQLGKAAADLVETIRRELAGFRSDFSGTAGSLSRLTTRLDTLAQMIDKGSTAGKLVSSNELYEEVRETNSELKALIEDIKAHPDKYVKVRFSIFR